MKHIFTIMIAILLIALTAPCNAMTSQEILGQAIDGYRTAMDSTDYDLRLEHFRRSMRLFMKVVDESDISNADLYTNLGNAAVQAGESGYAVWAYRNALQVNPAHRQASQNLDYARQSLLPDWVPQPESGTLLDTFFYWYRTLTDSVRRVLVTFCFFVFAIFTSIWLRWQPGWSKSMAIFTLMVWAVLFSLDMVHQYKPGSRAEAVVVLDELAAYAADSLGAQPRFAQPLPGGTELKIVEDRGDWSHVMLADGRDGWVRTSGLRRVDE